VRTVILWGGEIDKLEDGFIVYVSDDDSDWCIIGVQFSEFKQFKSIVYF
jgi:hypothetical protein